MKTALLLYAFTAPFLFAACVAFADGNVGAPKPLPLIEDPIALDGRLDEPAWAAAATFDRFGVFRRFGQDGPHRTEALLLTDGEFLYVGLRCEDGGAELARRQAAEAPGAPQRQGREAGTDSVSFMLDPQFGIASLIRWSVSPGGSQGRLSFMGEAYPDNLTVEHTYATSATAEGWTAEIRIPLRGTGLLWHVNEARPEVTFRINAIRNLRLPDERGGESYVLVLANTVWGYWDQERFQPAFVTRGGEHRRITLPEEGVLRNVPSVPVSARRAADAPGPFVATWSDVEGNVLSRAEPTTVRGRMATARLPITEFGRGRWIRWARVELDGRLVVERPYVVRYDAPVTMLTNFALVSEEPAQRRIDFVAPDYVGSLDGARIELSLHRPDDARFGEAAELPALELNAQRRASMEFEDIFARLGGGDWRLTATLTRGGEAVASHTLRFTKGRTPVPDDLVFDWGGFERVGDNAPNAWADTDDPELQGTFPFGWALGKQARFLRWADSRVIENAVYEGKRTLHAFGYGIGGQTHILTNFLRLDLSKRYKLTFMARGRGQVRVRYYTKNQHDEWLSHYFQSEWTELNDEWTLHEIPIVDFDMDVNRTWAGTEPKCPKPYRVRLCIWPQDDSELFIDNVFLRAIDKE